MLLAIDMGNTNGLFAIHDGVDWRARWRSSSDASRTADDYAAWLTQLLSLKALSFADIDGCIISSVVPHSLFHLRNLSRRYLGIEALIIGENIDPGIKIRNVDPREVGADRLVNAVGARASYEGALLVIDSGTATTFDLIAEDGAFEGGVIAPGINLSMRALHEAAARLPRIEIRRPLDGRVIGHDTVSAMQSGVYWGYLDLIDGLAKRITSEYGKPLKIIATGGVASIFAGISRMVDECDPDLTICGLQILYQRSEPDMLPGRNKEVVSTDV